MQGTESCRYERIKLIFDADALHSDRLWHSSIQTRTLVPTWCRPPLIVPEDSTRPKVTRMLRGQNWPRLLSDNHSNHLCSIVIYVIVVIPLVP
ncbi:hypothetical protein CDV36_011258 [Fusarium kuroshium]|uniref:Uncharacterized protein n=1 Tax=Fusarium kuroshium TaxID=2010991 RepID=A0A3M2RV11_9HYPO|nr:hypothetical protein CDV36_011258 [Fusarium kuroshium]